MQYKDYKLLNESFGSQVLGLKNPNSASNSFNVEAAMKVIEEAKKKAASKKKKMFGGELGDDEDGDEVDVKVKPDMDDSDDGDDKGCSCKDKEPEVDVDVDDEGDDDDDMDDEGDDMPMGPKRIEFQKKKMKSDKKSDKKCDDKKKMCSGKKKMQEGMFGHKYQMNFSRPEVGSPEYRSQFFESIKEQFGDPSQKFNSGVEKTYDEEALLSPHDRESMPGQVGYAPQNRVGTTSQQQAALPSSDWESKFEPLTAEDFIYEKGLNEEFEKWIGEKLLNEGKRVNISGKKRFPVRNKKFKK